MGSAYRFPLGDLLNRGRNLRRGFVIGGKIFRFNLGVDLFRGLENFMKTVSAEIYG
jgi:hypothetical protein